MQAAVTVIGRRNPENDRQPANLVGAELPTADLSGANLTKVILRNANLTGADLTGANLTGADLIGTVFTNTDLTGVDLTDATYFGNIPLPKGWVRDPDSGRISRASEDASDAGD